MKTRTDENDETPPHDGVAMSLWMNQVAELCRQARERERTHGPETPPTPPPVWIPSRPSPTPRESHYMPPRVRPPHVCKHPDGLIAQSWTDAAIRTQRLTRDHIEVIVNGADPCEFRSIAKAFKAFELPKKFIVDLRKRVKLEYQRFVNGESESEFVAIEHNNDIFVFRIIKRHK